MKRVFTVFGIIFGVFAVMLLAAFLYYIGVTWSVTLDPAKLALETSSVTFYDGANREIERTAREEDVPFSEFPEYLPNAFVAVEDKRFFSHGGFDTKRIAMAAFKNITSFSFREGASTISQQLIKNTHLTSEKTVNRKLKEFKLTRILEENYSKEEILELYLNSIYFGHSAFGIGDAAHFYFAKRAKELTPAESALLAALVKSPNRYSPFKSPDSCLARRNFVLSLMQEQGFLEEGEYEAAVKEPLPQEAHPLGRGNYFLALALDELADLFPDAKAGELGNLQVFTAYDPLLQAELEKIEAESDVIALVRDNKRNALKALHTTAGLLRRLPASTIKPLLVYGPAIEENLLSPATPILDEKTDFAGYSPDDAGGASGRYVSAREALSRSVNIPAVKVLNSLGIERGARYLARMHLPVGQEDYSLALALGGMKEGFTLKELADGYSTFANGGNFTPSSIILRIEDGTGRTLYKREEAAERVFSEDTSFLITDMLKSAATEGTARKLKSLPFSVAAKTGTHEGALGNLDAYTIAYTKEDTVGVWMGNADNSPLSATGGGLPANAVKSILEYIYREGAPEEFSQPTGAVKVAFDREEYETNHNVLLADALAPPITTLSEYFRAENVPVKQSTKFSQPTIQKPQLNVDFGGVNIVLCEAEYYDYIVKRENRGTVATIYSGAFRKQISDYSVVPGESYTYTVIPVYKGREGDAVELPRVKIPKNAPLPDAWWAE
ncbi:MAG: penicillin-binding protein [Clostridia bacterium]|nr:penicillin-binding protein [Clostridia bacterium]